MDDTVKPGSDGRLADGRFATGNRLAVGNPVNRRMAAMRARLLDAVSGDEVERIGRKMAELAAAGDTTAARLVLEHVVGKPPQALELTGADGGPLGVDWGRVQGAILAALARFPEARLAVALELGRLADDGAGRVDPGPGPRGLDAGDGA